jgi:hypothetical protein
MMSGERSTQGHRSLRAHPQRPQAVGQPVGAAVELAVGEALLPHRHGHGIGRARGPGLEQAVQGLLRGVDARHSPTGEELLALAGGQQGELGERAAGVLDDAGEEDQIVVDHPQDGRLVEEVGVVLPVQDRPVIARRLAEAHPLLGPWDHDDVHVHLGRTVAAHQELGVEAAELEVRHRGVVKVVHDLEERVAAELALRLQLLDEPLERHVLVGVDLQGEIPHPAEENLERGVAPEVAAQQEAVNHHADHPLDLARPAVGVAGADHDVRLSRIALEQGEEAGEHRHVEGEALAAAELAQCVVEIGRHQEELDVAGEGRPRRPRPVGRDFQAVRRPREVLPPEAQ